MTQWEYQIIDLEGSRRMDALTLNAWGEKSWELVAIGMPHPGIVVAYIKRPIVQLGPLGG